MSDAVPLILIVAGAVEEAALDEIHALVRDTPGLAGGMRVFAVAQASELSPLSRELPDDVRLALLIAGSDSPDSWRDAAAHALAAPPRRLALEIAELVDEGPEKRLTAPRFRAHAPILIACRPARDDFALRVWLGALSRRDADRDPFALWQDAAPDASIWRRTLCPGEPPSRTFSALGDEPWGKGLDKRTRRRVQCALGELLENRQRHAGAFPAELGIGRGQEHLWAALADDAGTLSWPQARASLVREPPGDEGTGYGFTAMLRSASGIGARVDPGRRSTVGVWWSLARHAPQRATARSVVFLVPSPPA